MFRLKFSKNRAFTLIELLIVAIIISALVGTAIPSYLRSKRKTEYNAAAAQVRTICGLAKDYFLTFDSYPATSTTAQTKAVLGNMTLNDDYFNTFRIVSSGGTFIVLVNGGNCVYTFNSAGRRTGINGGSDCLPD